MCYFDFSAMIAKFLGEISGSKSIDILALKSGKTRIKSKSAEQRKAGFILSVKSNLSERFFVVGSFEGKIIYNFRPN
jgi:hypothetical protein